MCSMSEAMRIGSSPHRPRLAQVPDLRYLKVAFMVCIKFLEAHFNIESLLVYSAR